MTLRARSLFPALPRLLAVCLAFILGPRPAPADWDQWRGPKRDGVSTETDWKVWGAEGPKQAWRAQIGRGYSAVAVTDGLVYSLGNDGTQDTVWCLSADTGAVVWRHDYPCGTDREYPGPRATPSVDGKVVYSLSRKGHLFALDARKGSVLWQKDVSRDPGAALPKWDFAGSPLVIGDALVLNAGTKGMALDKRTGKTLWTSGKGAAGYASPVPFEIGKQAGVLLFCAKGLAAVDPKSGRELWWHPWETKYDVNSADPVVAGDRVFLSSDYDHGCVMLQIQGGKPAVAWENQEMRNHTNACVLLDGHLYGNDGTVKKGDLKCIEVRTGEVKWSERKLTGSVAAAGGKLLFLGDKGTLKILEANPAGCRELASAQVLEGQCWTVPVLSNGRIYCRNTDGNLVCLDVR